MPEIDHLSQAPGFGGPLEAPHHILRKSTLLTGFDAGPCLSWQERSYGVDWTCQLEGQGLGDFSNLDWLQRARHLSSDGD